MGASRRTGGPRNPTSCVWPNVIRKLVSGTQRKTSILGPEFLWRYAGELGGLLLLVIPDFLEDEMPPSAVLHIIADREDDLISIAAE